MRSDWNIWAAFGRTDDSFAISVGLMDDDPQFSRILIYDASTSIWRQIDLDVTIVSITGSVEPGVEGSYYVALGIDGDVFYIGDSISREKIPGSGVVDDGSGPGSLSQIRFCEGQLMACGYGSQAYVRGVDGWRSICDESSPGVGKNSFEGIVTNSRGIFALCGKSEMLRRQLTPQEWQILATLETNRAEYSRRFREFRLVRPSSGSSLFIGKEDNWRFCEMPNSQKLRDVASIDDKRFLAVGGAGTMVVGSGPDDVEMVSEPGLLERLKAVRVHDRKVYVLGETSIFIYDLQLKPEGSILLPTDPPSSMFFDVTEGSIWYFDSTAVARFRNQFWETFAIPD